MLYFWTHFIEFDTFCVIVDPLLEGRLQGDMNAIDATLYQSYQVNMINRVRAKTEMHLGKLQKCI